MRFKLDENLGARTQRAFVDAGHDTQTVRQESLQGASDQQLYDACRTERRCLVTLDLDFADVTRFPPGESGGIAVIRFPRNPSLPLLENLVRQFLRAVSQMPIDRKLWIVEIGRIRVHRPDMDEETEAGW
jgi:predicted nuclease of predicted toxin-antitoxin system